MILIIGILPIGFLQFLHVHSYNMSIPTLFLHFPKISIRKLHQIHNLHIRYRTRQPAKQASMQRTNHPSTRTQEAEIQRLNELLLIEQQRRAEAEAHLAAVPDTHPTHPQPTTPQGKLPPLGVNVEEQLEDMKH